MLVKPKGSLGWMLIELLFQSDVGVYTCEASNDMGQMFAVLSVPDNKDLPDIVTEEEEKTVVTGNKEELKSGSVTNNGGLMSLISMAATVLLRIRV